MIEGVVIRRLQPIRDDRGELCDYDEPDEQRLSPFDNDLDYDWRAVGAVSGH